MRCVQSTEFRERLSIGPDSTSALELSFAFEGGASDWFHFGFNELVINQSFSELDFVHDDCPAYNLRLSDFDQLNPEEVSSFKSYAVGTYTYHFGGTPTRDHVWLLTAPAHVIMQSTSSLSVSINVLDYMDTYCQDPMVAIQDSNQFIITVFSFVSA